MGTDLEYDTNGPVSGRLTRIELQSLTEQGEVWVHGVYEISLDVCDLNTAFAGEATPWFDPHRYFDVAAALRSTGPLPGDAWSEVQLTPGTGDFEPRDPTPLAAPLILSTGDVLSGAELLEIFAADAQAGATPAGFDAEADRADPLMEITLSNHPFEQPGLPLATDSDVARFLQLALL